MDTVPRSYSVRRKVPGYKPARTPHVGRTIKLSRGRNYADLAPYVVIREATGGEYWIAPVLPDGSLGPMTTAPIDKPQLTRGES